MLSNVRGLLGQLRLRAVRTPGLRLSFHLGSESSETRTDTQFLDSIVDVRERLWAVRQLLRTRGRARISFRNLASESSKTPSQLLDDGENIDAGEDLPTPRALDDDKQPLSVVVSRLPPFTTHSDLRHIAGQLGVRENQILGASIQVPLTPTARHLSAMLHFSEPFVALNFHRQATKMLLQVLPGGSPSRPAIFRVLPPSELSEAPGLLKIMRWDKKAFYVYKFRAAEQNTPDPRATSNKDHVPSPVVFSVSSSLFRHSRYSLSKVKALEQAGATCCIQFPLALNFMDGLRDDSVFAALAENRLFRELGSFGILESVQVWRRHSHGRLWIASVRFVDIYGAWAAFRLLQQQSSVSTRIYYGKGMRFVPAGKRRAHGFQVLERPSAEDNVVDDADAPSRADGSHGTSNKIGTFEQLKSLLQGEDLEYPEVHAPENLNDTDSPLSAPSGKSVTWNDVIHNVQVVLPRKPL
ncbi:hypothetical protein C8F01DRAFT_1105757 [Mycena amicta]|nr:hypothetical protein C8F01DRAFT_1105757 [Mycena amicta]